MKHGLWAVGVFSCVLAALPGWAQAEPLETEEVLEAEPGPSKADEASPGDETGTCPLEVLCATLPSRMDPDLENKKVVFWIGSAIPGIGPWISPLLALPSKRIPPRSGALLRTSLLWTVFPYVLIPLPAAVPLMFWGGALVFWVVAAVSMAGLVLGVPLGYGTWLSPRSSSWASTLISLACCMGPIAGVVVGFAGFYASGIGFMVTAIPANILRFLAVGFSAVSTLYLVPVTMLNRTNEAMLRQTPELLESPPDAQAGQSPNKP